MKITATQAKPFAGIAFPGYKGRKFEALYTNSVIIHNTNWDGGSLNEYVALEISADAKSKKFAAPAPWENFAEGKDVPLPQGKMIVRHTRSCGADLGLTFYINPADAPKLIGKAA